MLVDWLCFPPWDGRGAQILDRPGSLSGSLAAIRVLWSHNLMACEVEGKSPRTVQAYDETLRVFRPDHRRGEPPRDSGRLRGGRRLPPPQGDHGQPSLPGHPAPPVSRDPRLPVLVRPHGLCAEAPLLGHSQCASRTEGDPAVLSDLWAPASRTASLEGATTTAHLAGPCRACGDQALEPRAPRDLTEP